MQILILDCPSAIASCSVCRDEPWVCNECKTGYHPTFGKYTCEREYTRYWFGIIKHLKTEIMGVQILWHDNNKIMIDQSVFSWLYDVI